MRISDWSSDVCSSDLWLAAYASGLPRPDPAELPRRLWYAGHSPKIARFPQGDPLRDKALVGPWAEALLAEAIALATDSPDSAASLPAPPRRLGQTRPPFSYEPFDVPANPAPDTP